MKDNKSYNPAIDALRVISIIAVILIHTSSRFLEAVHFDLKSLPLVLLQNQLARFAVPLFFMISGFVLELSFSKHQSFVLYFKKRISKIVVPYIFWSAIYYFFVYTKHDPNFLRTLLVGSTSYQLYFIPTLLIFYFVFPILHALYKFITHKWILAFLAVVQVILLFVDYHNFGINIYFPLRIVLLNFFVFIFGMWAYRNQEKVLNQIIKWKFILLITSVLLGGLVYFEGFSRYYHTFNFESFYSQWRPSIMLYTLSVSAILYYIFSKIKISSKFIQTLSELSFFVFFIHTWILELLWKNNLHTGLFISVTLISFALAFVAHKLPYLSKITG